MREKKFQFNWYQANDTAAMERKLEKMAEKGWLLDEMTNWGFRYRRSEPRRAKYAVTFFPEASIFDGAPTEGQETYADYCAAAGWELVGNWGPLQIFRSSRENPVPIETDEAEKLQAIHKSMLKTAILSYGMLLVVWIMNLTTKVTSIKRNPLAFFSSNRSMFLLFFQFFFVVYLAFILIDYFIWYLRSKKNVERGEACLQPHTKLRFWFGMVMLAVCALAVVGYLSDITSPGDALIWVYAFGGMALIMAISQFILRTMKRRGCSRGATRGAFIAAAVVLSVVYAAGIMPLVMKLNDADLMRDPDAEIYVDSRGYEWEIYHDELPVTLEDLGYTVTEEDHCSYAREVEKSLILTHIDCTQRAHGDESQLPAIYYEVVTARWDWVLDLCWDLLYRVGERLTSSFTSEPLAPAPWGAENAFYNRFPYGYCLRFEDRIIILDPDEELTEEQLALVVETLRYE